MNPEISVIVPVYNVGDYIKDSITSILNQTFRDFEIICVDDGSTDNSLEILNELADADKRVKVYHQENAGGGAARNFALRKAQGNYIFFLDADDTVKDNVLEKSYDLITNKNADFILFKAINYNDIKDEYYHSDYISMDSIYDKVGDETFHYRDIGDLIFEMSATPWGKLYNHDFVKRSGAQFAEGCAFHDNIFFWEALFNSERICFLNETLYYHLLHSGSIQGSKDKKFLDIFPVVTSIFEMFVKYDNFNTYKKKLYNWKIQLFDKRYRQIQDQYKEQFLTEFKRDLNESVQKEGEDELLSLLTSKSTAIYNNVCDANTYVEYNLLREKYKLTRKVKKLKKENRKLKNELKELKDSSNDGLLSKFKLR